MPVAEQAAVGRRAAAAMDRVIADPDRRRLVDGGLRAVRERYAWASVRPQYRQALAPPG